MKKSQAIGSVIHEHRLLILCFAVEPIRAVCIICLWAFVVLVSVFLVSVFDVINIKPSGKQRVHKLCLDVSFVIVYILLVPIENENATKQNVRDE